MTITTSELADRIREALFRRNGTPQLTADWLVVLGVFQQCDGMVIDAQVRR